MANLGKSPSLLFVAANVVLAVALGYWLLGPWGIAVGLAVYALLFLAFMALKRIWPKPKEPERPAKRSRSQENESRGPADLLLAPIALFGVVIMGAVSLFVGAVSMMVMPFLKYLPDPPRIRPAIDRLLTELRQPNVIGWLALNIVLLVLFLTLWLGIEVILVLALIATPIFLMLIATMAMRGRDPY